MTTQDKSKTGTLWVNFKAVQGFYFGLGFWLAWAAVTIVILPVLMCGAFFVLSLFGMSLGALVAPN